MPIPQKTVPEIPGPSIPPDDHPIPQSPKEMCRAVERTAAREPLDRVVCSHLFGDYYRCNWWSRAPRPKAAQDYDWGGTLSDHIRQSRFLRVTVGPAGVDVQTVTARANGTGAD